LGGILAGVAFLCSAGVEIELEKTYPILPGVGVSQLRVFNGLPCQYTVTTSIPGATSNFILYGMSEFRDRYVDVTQQSTYTYTMTPNSTACQPFTGTFNLRSETAISYFLSNSGVREYEDEPNKSSTGDPTLRILVNSPTVRTLKVVDIEHPNRLVRFEGMTNASELIQLVSSTYDITIGDYNLPEYTITQGAVNTYIVRELSSTNFDTANVVIAEPNSMNMLWLLPQYVIMTLGEVMFSITGLAFSYAQAPLSMKSVLQSCWLLTVAFGNVIDIIVIGAQGFSSQAHEFFLFAGLMFVDMIIFMILAYRYKSIATSSEQEEILKDQSTTDGLDEKKEGLDNVTFKKD